ncbi:hypothetical protein NOCA250034 [metagenome]|uniref:Manganese transport regulator n=1 Tax=metagenome TaxID=256318 RepID=A0A2P2C8T0_9ZZZZ
MTSRIRARKSWPASGAADIPRLEGMRVALEDLSQPALDYLKAIWSIQDATGPPATVKAVSARNEVTPSTVSTMVRRLQSLGLVAHTPYSSIELTEEGQRLALKMVRRHRLLETYLVLELGYSWDEVQGEARRLAHAVSDTYIERLDDRLGHPPFDPHGDPVPKADGRIDKSTSMLLTDVASGSEVVIDKGRRRSPRLPARPGVRGDGYRNPCSSRVARTRGWCHQARDRRAGTTAEPCEPELPQGSLHQGVHRERPRCWRSGLALGTPEPARVVTIGEGAPRDHGCGHHDACQWNGDDSQNEGLLVHEHRRHQRQRDEALLDREWHRYVTLVRRDREYECHARNLDVTRHPD